MLSDILDRSILQTIRRHIVGYDESNPAFDTQLIDHINSAFMRLNQLNVGVSGFRIQDESSKWSDFIGPQTKVVGAVVTYVKDSVQLSFDPPQNSYHTNAIKDRMDKYEWLLNVEVDPEYE